MGFREFPARSAARGVCCVRADATACPPGVVFRLNRVFRGDVPGDAGRRERLACERFGAREARRWLHSSARPRARRPRTTPTSRPRAPGWLRRGPSSTRRTSRRSASSSSPAASPSRPRARQQRLQPQHRRLADVEPRGRVAGRHRGRRPALDLRQDHQPLGRGRRQRPASAEARSSGSATPSASTCARRSSASSSRATGSILSADVRGNLDKGIAELQKRA